MEIAQAFGQIIQYRHGGRIQQNGNDHHIRALKRRLNFQPDKIIRVMQALIAVLIGDGQPGRANHDQHHRRLIQRIVQSGNKVLTGMDAADILENEIRAKLSGQVIVDPACDIAAVGTTIGDEDALLTGVGLAVALERGDEIGQSSDRNWPSGKSN